MKGRRPALIILVLLVALIGQYINILYQRLHDIERDNVSLKDQNAKLQSRLSKSNYSTSTSNYELIHNNNDESSNYTITYGHIHMAKTGGTALNGM